MRLALDQPAACAREAVTTAPTAWLSRSRWVRDSWSTSAAARTAVRTVRSATAARATDTKASDSRIRSVAASRALTIPVQAEAVAAAQHGLDDLRLAGVGLDLAPQVLDVRVDAALVALELVAARAVDDLVPRVDPPRDRRQRDQHAPLGRGQRHAGPADLDRPALLVDHQQALAIAGRRGGPAVGLAPPAQDGLAAQDQLARAERLGHVVVGAHLQAADPVFLVRLGRQHQDGRGARGADL